MLHSSATWWLDEDLHSDPINTLTPLTALQNYLCTYRMLYGRGLGPSVKNVFELGVRVKKTNILVLIFFKIEKKKVRILRKKKSQK